MPFGSAHTSFSLLVVSSSVYLTESFMRLQVFDILSERAKNEVAFGHLPTGLPALDASLWGGIPFGVMTEVVGPAGIGKTQV